MKKIQIGGHNKGYKLSGWALVDDDDFEELNQYKWHALKKGRKMYAMRNILKDNGKRSSQSMHGFIKKPIKGLEVDHIDGNGLNNQKNNLRVCSHADNLKNQGKQRSNTSGYKRVSWHKASQKWGANITANGRQYHIGLFTTKEEAYAAYCAEANKYHGEFTNLG